MIPTVNTAIDSEKEVLPNEKLDEKSIETDILPELKHNSLLSVCNLVDSGYTTILFHMTEGWLYIPLNIFQYKWKRSSYIQGWENKSGLWRFSIKYKVYNDNTYTLFIDHPTPQD